MRESRCTGGGDSVVLVVTLSVVRTDGGISTASRDSQSTIQKLSGVFFVAREKKLAGVPFQTTFT